MRHVDVDKFFEKLHGMENNILWTSIRKKMITFFFTNF